MSKRIHGIAGLAALLLIGLFFSATVFVELRGDEAAIVGVKQAILYGLVLLVPTMIVIGLSGRAVTAGRHGRLIATKQRRLVIAAANGLLGPHPTFVSPATLSENV